MRRMEEQWSKEVMTALEALEQLPTVWFASTVGFDITPAEGQSARLYREDGQWYIELSLWKKTFALRELYEGCDVALVIAGGRKRVHGYDARIDSYREFGPSPSGFYNEEQNALIQRKLSAPRTGDSEKLSRVKGMIDALDREDRASLRPWVLAHYDDDGNEQRGYQPPPER